MWWAWGCAKQSAGEEPTGDTAKSLEATRVWLAEPTDERRRAAARIGNEVDDPDAAAMAAMAVLFAKYFGAAIPGLTSDGMQFAGMVVAYLLLVLGCLIRTL